ncbi:MAG: NAD-dependent protein deacylase [Candidatus Lokiarchaeota archaeon]|nr:NAD-dependent protein deacylase [Candidatus Lokiarchaeota archaeon]
MGDYETRIKQAAQLIHNSQYMVIFTGAGVSTESGIPDFRGPNGLWTRRDKGLSPPKSPKWSSVEPNSAHDAIVELQNMGLMKFLISQNVDNLHLKSGIKEELIAEFHGNMELMRCLDCDRKYQKKRIWDEEKWGKGYRASPVKEGQIPCPECGGRIISSIVNFGDPIPDKELSDSFKHSKMADVFLVVGSSLSVTPAAYCPQYALANQADLIIINNQPTPFDNAAIILFHENAGETLTGILKEIHRLTD